MAKIIRDQRAVFFVALLAFVVLLVNPFQYLTAAPPETNEDPGAGASANASASTGASASASTATPTPNPVVPVPPTPEPVVNQGPTDGRIAWAADNPFAFFCQGDYQLVQIWTGGGNKVYEFPYSWVAQGAADGGSFQFADGNWRVSLGYSGNDIVVMLQNGEANFMQVLPRAQCGGA